MIVHYQNSLMRPQVSVLQHLRARPELDREQRPVVIEGAHSYIAKLRRADGAHLALRIPRGTVDVEQWQTRYAGLRRLALTTLRGRIPGSPEVMPAGLDVDERGNVPVLVMDWVSGPTLAAAVRRAAANGGVLRALASAVVDLANGFREAGFAHQNLHPDNLIISSSGALVAVGLDHAIWNGGPMSGPPVDTLAYQHPEGPVGGSDSDAFATLVLFASLRVLAEAPDLAAVYGDAAGTQAGALLFSTWDLADPGASRVFADISTRVSPETREFVDALHQACLEPATESERFVRSIPRLRPIADQRVVAAPKAPAAPAESAGWDVAQAIERARARFAADERQVQDSPGNEPPAAWGTWSSPASTDPSWPVSSDSPSNRADAPTRRESNRARRKPSESRDTSPGLAAPDVGPQSTPRTRSRVSRPVNPVQVPVPPQEPPVPTGDGFAAERDLLRDALRRRDELAVVQLWSRLADDPVARTMTLHVEELVAAGLQSRIRQDAGRKRDAAVLDLAGQAASRGLMLDSATRALVRVSEERIRVREQLDAAISSGAQRELADLAVSGDLMALGDTDRGSLRTVLRALEWPALERALASDDDHIILSAFDAELFDQGGALASEVRDRIDLARRRVTWRVDVRHALKARNASALEELFRQPPSLAIERLSASERRRTRRLIEQQRAVDALQAAVKAKDDTSIVSALNHVERVGARIPDRHTWNAIQKIVERTSLIEDILAAAKAVPMDYERLAQLVPAARSLGVERDPRLRGEFSLDRLGKSLVRQAHLRRIRAALVRDDDAAIVMAAVPDPHGVLDELDDDERTRIAAAIKARRRVDRQAVAERFEHAGSPMSSGG